MNKIKAVNAAEKKAETPHYPDRGVVWGCVTATPLQTAGSRSAFFLNSERALGRGNAGSLGFAWRYARDPRCPRTQQVGGIVEVSHGR